MTRRMYVVIGIALSFSIPRTSYAAPSGGPKSSEAMSLPQSGEAANQRASGLGSFRKKNQAALRGELLANRAKEKEAIGRLESAHLANDEKIAAEMKIRNEYFDKRRAIRQHYRDIQTRGGKK